VKFLSISSTAFRYSLLIVFGIVANVFFTGCETWHALFEHEKKPVADFGYVIDYSVEPAVIRFENKSKNAVTYRWTIGQDLILTDENPVVPVRVDGELPVRLEAMNMRRRDIKDSIIVIKIPFGLPKVKDVSYSWWCDPISIYHNGVNYFSGVGKDGRQSLFMYLSEFNSVVEKELYRGYSPDEHNSPSFIALSDKLLTAYTGHDNDSRVTVKTVSFDFSTEGTPSTIFFPGSTSYTQLFQAGSRIFLTTRCIARWYICWSDDFGLTWSIPTPFIEKTSTVIPGAFYIRPMVISQSKIIIGSYTHPVTAGDKLKLYYTVFNPLTGDVVNEAETVLGNVYNGKSIVSLESLDVVHSATTDNTFRFLDIAINDKGNPVFLIATTQVNNYDAGDYRLLERDTNAKATHETYIVPHGRDLPHDTYWGGAYFVIDENHLWNGKIYLAREQQNNWYIEKYGYTNGAVKLEQLIEHYYSTDRRTLSRPLPPINSPKGGLSVIYQKGEYFDYPSYKYWRNMELILVGEQ
jgi:PKD repeat protein